MEEKPLSKYKVTFMGPAKSGKTCLVSHLPAYGFDEDYKPTVGIDFVSVTDHVRGRKLQLWDTAGQERFRSLIPSYIRDAHLILIVFDVTSKESFQHAHSFLDMANEDSKTILILVGTKNDLANEREVSLDEAEEYAQKHRMMYLDYSAKTGLRQAFLDKLNEGIDKYELNKD